MDYTVLQDRPEQVVTGMSKKSKKMPVGSVQAALLVVRRPPPGLDAEEQLLWLALEQMKEPKVQEELVNNVTVEFHKRLAAGNLVRENGGSKLGTVARNLLSCLSL